MRVASFDFARMIRNLGGVQHVVEKTGFDRATVYKWLRGVGPGRKGFETLLSAFPKLHLRRYLKRG